MADSPGGADQPIQLTDLPCSDTVTDRAFAAATRTAEWFRSEPIQRLLDIVGVNRPDLTDGATAISGSSERWLHLGEALPSWVLQLADDTSVMDAWTPERAAVAKACLDCIDLEQACADAFNFRSRDGKNYRERSQAVPGDFSDDQRRAILREAARLGLVIQTLPREQHYDLLLVLGGGYKSPLFRAEYASELVRGGVTADQIAFLGSPRFMIGDPPESPAVQDFAPGATDEYDLMRGAAATAFGFRPAPTTMICGCADASVICPQWLETIKPNAEVLAETPPAFTHQRWCELHDANGRLAGHALSAHTSRPPYRPDTSDTFALLKEMVPLAAGATVLIVTTQVFVPFQSFDALRRLFIPFGLLPDVVGFDASRGDRPETAEYLLQETLSAVRSARRLMTTACEALGFAAVHG